MILVRGCATQLVQRYHFVFYKLTLLRTGTISDPVVGISSNAVSTKQLWANTMASVKDWLCTTANPRRIFKKLPACLSIFYSDTPCYAQILVSCFGPYISLTPTEMQSSLPCLRLQGALVCMTSTWSASVTLLLKD